MRVGIFAANLAVRAGYENIVSGHLQVALESARLLAEEGCEVHIATSRFGAGGVMPAILDPRIRVHQVCYRDRIPNRLVHLGSPPGLPGPLGDMQTVWQLARLARRLKLDVFHFYGGPGSADLAGLVKFAGPGCAVAMTLYVGRIPARLPAWRSVLWKRADLMVTSTEYFRTHLVNLGVAAELLRHGITRSMQAETELTVPKSRVLFWREASMMNGGDIGLEVFRRLAPEFPDVQFDFALRPHRHQVSGIERLASEQPNVHLHMTPYPPEVSLERLLQESICVLHPFRGFTVQPQFSILESMAAGVPVVATQIESTSELIESGVSGLLVPSGNAGATVEAVRSLLLDRIRAEEMGARAKLTVARDWNWVGYGTALATRYKRLLRI